MPIRPENRARYPSNWKTEVRPAILERAGNRCEGSPDYPDCRAPNGWFRNKRTGDVTDDDEVVIDWYLRDGDEAIRIVLTIGHLDHVPENCDPSNLRAWCQRCHLNYDKQHHRQTYASTRRARSPQTDIFQDAHS